MADRSKIDAAQAGFNKLLKDQGGKKTMSNYETEAAAIRAKTMRLQALRLARDATEGKAPPQQVASPRNKSAAKQAKKPTGTLSDWLKDREGSGHNN